MTKEIIDGYEVEVTESKNFLTEVEEAALLLLDPSYFGQIPQSQKLSLSEIEMLTNGLPKWERPSAIKCPSGEIAKLASNLNENEVSILLNKLAHNLQPLCLVRLRCGELYNGSVLNYFSHMLKNAS